VFSLSAIRLLSLLSSLQWTQEQTWLFRKLEKKNSWLIDNIALKQRVWIRQWVSDEYLTTCSTRRHILDHFWDDFTGRSHGVKAPEDKTGVRIIGNPTAFSRKSRRSTLSTFSNRASFVPLVPAASYLAIKARSPLELRPGGGPSVSAARPISVLYQSRPSSLADAAASPQTSSPRVPSLLPVRLAASQDGMIETRVELGTRCAVASSTDEAHTT